MYSLFLNSEAVSINEFVLKSLTSVMNLLYRKFCKMFLDFLTSIRFTVFVSSFRLLILKNFSSYFGLYVEKALFMDRFSLFLQLLWILPSWFILCSLKDIVEERRWRKWTDEVLVHTLSPNVYRRYVIHIDILC